MTAKLELCCGLLLIGAMLLGGRYVPYGLARLTAPHQYHERPTLNWWGVAGMALTAMSLLYIVRR